MRAIAYALLPLAAVVAVEQSGLLITRYPGGTFPIITQVGELLCFGAAGSVYSPSGSLKSSLWESLWEVLELYANT